MAVFRLFASVLLAAVLGTARGAFALADPPPWAHGHGHGHHAEAPQPAFRPPAVLPFSAARAHGNLSGKVVGVDYGAASILVDTPHGLVPVAVTPTTSIIRGSTNASLADLGRGARISVDVTQVGGQLTAQIIRIH